MKMFFKKLREALVTYDIEFVEIMSGVAALSWGVWLVNPSINTFSSGPTYNTMEMMAPEVVWGVIMLVMGYLQLQSVVSHEYKLRKISALSLTILWIFITAVFGHANIASTAVVMYGVFAAFTGWSYLRLSQRVEIKSKFSTRNKHV